VGGPFGIAALRQDCLYREHKTDEDGSFQNFHCRPFCAENFARNYSSDKTIRSGGRSVKTKTRVELR
jgi:hypothetical protein